MSTIDDLVLKISVVDDARRELRAINKDLNSYTAQLKKVIAEEGAGSASARSSSRRFVNFV
jgi:hypothetical protein